MDAVMTALARHPFLIVSGRGQPFVSFVSFVVRWQINHERRETHENVRSGCSQKGGPQRFSSRLENLHTRGESGTLRVTADGEGCRCR